MLRLEIKVIWLSKWTYTKVLYLLVRYIPILKFGLVIYSNSSFCSERRLSWIDHLRQIMFYLTHPSVPVTGQNRSTSVSANDLWCLFASYSRVSGLLLAGVGAAEGDQLALDIILYNLWTLITAVLAIRTWAVWHQNVRLGIGLASLGACYFIAWGVFNIHYSQSMIRTLPLIVPATFSHYFRSIGCPVSQL